MRFIATKDFFSTETGSHYVTGLSYTARPRDTKLLSLIPIWASEGKIALGGPAAELSGTDRKRSWRSWFSRLTGAK